MNCSLMISINYWLGVTVFNPAVSCDAFELAMLEAIQAIVPFPCAFTCFPDSIQLDI